MAAFNTHEDFGWKQQGGTFGLAFGQLASRVKNVGTDDSSLGRWCWMQFRGGDGHVVQIIAACQPCRSVDTQLGTVWQQHHQYLDSQGCRQETPWQVFKMDLLAALGNWRQAGKWLILFIDANDTTKGPLNSALTGNNLQMREAVHSHHPSLLATPTFKSGGHLGKAPIDAAYLTPDLPLSAGTWISIQCCPSDHCFCVLDIRWKALVGEDLFKIAHPEARHLNSQIPLAQKKCKKQLTQSVKAHKIIEKLHSVYKSCDHSLSPQQQDQMNKIDKVKQELMLNAEWHCHKLCMGEINYLPDFQTARGCHYCWNMVIHKQLGKTVSSRKIKTLAWAVGIEKPLSVTLQQACRHWKAADEAYQALKKCAPML